MKINALRFFLFLATILLSACPQQQSVESRLAAIEKRLSTLERPIQPPPVSSIPPVPAEPTKPAPVELVAWDYRFTQGERSDYFYAITLQLKNTGTKDIKLIEASVDFLDLLGNKVYGISVTPDRSITAGETLTDKDHYPVNQFIPEQRRMAGMNRQDIKAALFVRRLVFTDNSIGEFMP